MLLNQSPRNDLFVSYPHVEDEPIHMEGELAAQARGWVTRLHDLLRGQLAKELGRKDAASIWTDRSKHRGNDEDDNILSAVSNSSLCLIVLSKPYLESEFCLEELQCFLDAHKDNLSQRLFIVQPRPMPKEAIPEKLRALRNYIFFAEDRDNQPRTYGEFIRPPQEYFNLVQDLARDMAAKLSQLSGSAGGITTEARPPTVAGSAVHAAAICDATAPAVLLAEAFGEVRIRRDEVRRYLEQSGVLLLPEGSYPPDFDALREAVTTDLERCALFVQLLGDVADNGQAWLQCEAAHKAKLPVVQWRDPQIKLEEVASPIWRALLNQDTVQAVPIEAFKQSIIAGLQRLKPPPLPDTPSLLINADPIDVTRAQLFQASLDVPWDSEVWHPNPELNPRALEETLLSKTLGCMAVIVFQGKSNPDWVVAQQKQVRKFEPQRKNNKKLKLRWVVYDEPEPPPPAVRLFGWDRKSVSEALRLLPEALS